jgi:hypothetical protein
LTNSNIGRPTDLWIPTSLDIQPEQTDQIACGVKFHPWPQTTFTVEAYRRMARNIVQYKRGESFIYNGTFTPDGLIPDYWYSLLEQGRSKARGIEFSFQTEIKDWSLSAYYGYARTEHQFPTTNIGAYTPSVLDFPHNASIRIGRSFSQSTRIHVDCSFHDGGPVTFVRSGYTYLNPIGYGQSVYIPEMEASSRMKYYLKMDVLAIFKIPGRRLDHYITCGISNLLNRKNPLYYKLNTNPDTQQTINYSNVYVAGILPVINYKLIINDN